MTWNEPQVQKFWRFVAERHEVFVRRHVYKHPPPWTEDPILQSLYMTNIYRELDRATRFLIMTTLERRTLTPEDKLFNVILFRSFTYEPTYMVLGAPFPAAEWDHKAAAGTLRAHQKAGHKLFTGAFMLSNQGSTQSKAAVTLRRISWAAKHAGALLEDLRGCAGLQTAHDLLRTRVSGFGGFMAYEVMIDLCWEQRVLPFDMNEWVFAGPGAVRGLQDLAPDIKAHEAEPAIRMLQRNQRGLLLTAGACLHGPELTLENVEQALCEWQKYRRAEQGGHTKRKFHGGRPIATSGWPWEGLPARFVDPMFWVCTQ